MCQRDLIIEGHKEIGLSPIFSSSPFSRCVPRGGDRVHFCLVFCLPGLCVFTVPFKNLFDQWEVCKSWPGLQQKK